MTDLPQIADDPQVRDVIKRALVEDIGPGDATTLALVPEDVTVSASIIARDATVVAGAPVAIEVFRNVDERIACVAEVAEGAAVDAGSCLLHIEGPARGILTGERLALNFMQRMCGIAALTAAFVARTREHGTLILDTRKTTPTLRVLEKYAVRCGGGSNHRMGLYDRVMIKDNHRYLCRGAAALTLAEAIVQARAAYPSLDIEVEVENDRELTDAMAAEPEWILLDNMSPEQMAACVSAIGGRARTEASGGITLESAAAVAASGVDAISLGCLTHSVPAADLSMEFGT